MHTNEKNFPMFSIGYKEISTDDVERLGERSRAMLHPAQLTAAMQ